MIPTTPLFAATLSLEPTSNCLTPGGNLVVEVRMTGAADLIVGGQFHLSYDSFRLDFSSAAPGDAPFTREIVLIEPTGSTVFYAVGTPDGIAGTSADSVIARLTFTVLGASGSACYEAGLVSFAADSGPFQTKLSDEFGQPVIPALSALSAVSIDNAAPTLTCPLNLTVACDGSTDPLDTGSATATDDCDPTPLISYLDVFTPSGPCGYTGQIARTWSAIDDCGNLSTCVQIITIQDVTPPVITCPPDAVVEWGTPYGPGVTGTASASDNCDPAPLVILAGDGPLTTHLGAPNPPGWSFYTTNTASGALVSGPGAPPAGVGSFEMRTGAGTGPGLGGKTFLGTRNYSGTLLSDLSTFRYRTYVSSASASLAHLAPSINLYVDLDGNGTRDTTFVFEPVYVPGQGAVAQDTWQTWDTLTTENGWWYTACFGALTACGGGEFHPLSHYIALYPSARIVDWGLTPGVQFVVGQTSGGDWANHIGYVDLIELNSDAHDFEPLSDPCPNLRVERVWLASDCAGNPSFCVQEIRFEDTTAPVITCPPDVTVDADADLGCFASAASVSAGAATATDTCDPAPLVVGVRSDSLALSDPYPAGTTTITWTATDNCGNASSCDQTIFVNNVNQVVATVELAGSYHDPDPFTSGTVLLLTRCITFEFWSCPGGAPDEIVEVPVTWTITDGVVAPETVQFSVPCGVYTCVTARDRLHTLRRTDDAPGLDGFNRLVVDFTGADALVGGNLNDDFYIDILDFGVYSWQFATSYGGGDTPCGTAFPHADVNRSGAVSTPDFTFIQVNFLKSHEANCCGTANGPDDEAGDGPVLRIAVKELAERGLAHLAAGDLDGDGWLDARDVAAFLMGARPRNAGPAAARVAGSAALKFFAVSLIGSGGHPRRPAHRLGIGTTPWRSWLHDTASHAAGKRQPDSRTDVVRGPRRPPGS